jgi:formylmethanofuran dehydrogenase subunit B
MNQHSKHHVTHHDVPCPFCSLLCDDLSIQQVNGKLKIINNGCPKAIQHFERTREKLKAHINGKTCTLDQAVMHAAGILRKSKQPLFAGLGTDVGGMRSVIALAEQTGGILDHMHSNAAMSNIKVLQDQGWVMTTLAEIKNRADLILFIGTDAATNYPRFFERVVWNKHSLNKITKRDIIFIGEDLDIRHGTSPSRKKPVSINCKEKYVGEIIATIHALIVGNKIKKSSVGGLPLSQLETLAATMKKAQYGVVVWAPGELDLAHSELTIQSLCELIKYLNRTTRYAGFSLGGNDGGASAINVCTWQSGYPLRLSYATGAPVYNPYRYSTERALLHNEADAVVWISSFGTKVNLPQTATPVILLSDMPVNTGRMPDVFIPVGTPGMDHKGQLIRTDNVVSLRLKEIIHGQRDRLANVLDRILQALQAV